MGYRGELIFIYKNRTSRDVLFPDWDIELAALEMENELLPYKVGERIGQIIILPYPNIEFIESSTLEESERGEGGFGSTGK